MMPLVRQEGEIIDLILKIFDVHEICKRFKVPMMNEQALKFATKRQCLGCIFCSREVSWVSHA